MSRSNEMASSPSLSPSRSNPAQVPRSYWTAVVGLVIVFAWPLYRLIRFSVGHELYSHIILIPLISGYLVWQARRQLPAASAPHRGVAALCLALGTLVLLAFLAVRLSSPALPADDWLAFTTLSFLLFFAGVTAWHLGRATLRAILFPLGFLVFMIPLPTALLLQTETWLQYGSAFAARGFFALAGTTVFVQGLVFQLPGISLQVAPECSGIHSSLALLITSVLAGYYFLRSPTHRVLLALAVIPLALLRNGLRVFVIGELCVRIGPHMIDSYIHRHGGPVFFVLSLIPFFFFLVWLVRRERRSSSRVAATAA